MNRLMRGFSVLAVAAFLFGTCRNVRATSKDNGANGYADQSVFNAALNVPIVPAGIPVIVPRIEYHSEIVAQGHTSITDEDLFNLINTNFRTNGVEKYTYLNIHMAQCYSGGMIDELDHGVGAAAGLNNFTINTAAIWNKPSSGSKDQTPAVATERNFYSSAWMNQVDSAVAANRQMLNAYTSALTDATYGAATRAAERPQFFSRPNARDTDSLIKSAGSNIAMLFIGSHQQGNDGSRRRHYRDALRMYNILTTRYGYAPADIKVYYDNGAAPPMVAGLPIDGKATVANFNSFFSAPPKPINNTSDNVFIWTSDHGGLDLKIRGLVQMAPKVAAIGKAAEYTFDATADFLAAVNGIYASEQMGLPFFQMDALTNPASEPISVYLNNSLLGTITSAADQLSFSPGLLTSNGNHLRFETFTSDPSIVTLSDFGLNAFTSILEVPEPVSGVLLLVGISLLIGRCRGPRRLA